MRRSVARSAETWSVDACSAPWSKAAAKSAALPAIRNPFARAFREGFARPHKVKAETVATAIKIGDPASLDRAIGAVRLTNGVVADVTDDAETLRAALAPRGENPTKQNARTMPLAS